MFWSLLTCSNQSNVFFSSCFCFCCWFLFWNVYLFPNEHVERLQPPAHLHIWRHIYMPNQWFTHQSVPKVGNVILYHHWTAGKKHLLYYSTCSTRFNTSAYTGTARKLLLSIYTSCVWVIHSPKKVQPFDLGPPYLAYISVSKPHGQWPAPMGSWGVV